MTLQILTNANILLAGYSLIENHAAFKLIVRLLTGMIFPRRVIVFVVYINVGFGLVIINIDCILYRRLDDIRSYFADCCTLTLTALSSRRLIRVLISSLNIPLSRGPALLGPNVFPFVLRAEVVVVVVVVITATAAAITATVADFVIDSSVCVSVSYYIKLA